MAKSDNLYTLDAVDTDLTAPSQVVKALQVATTDTASQRFGEGLQAFGAAVGRAGEVKKAELLKEDIRTAQNAALRNEAMPGGLSNEVIDSYNRTASIVAGNEHLKTATMYYEGDEFKTILNSTELSSDEKITSITKSSSEFLLNGQYALKENPDIYLKYMEGLDALKTDAIKSIYNFDKTQQEYTGIQAMQSQIQLRIKEGLPVTGEYIGNLADSYRKSAPWTDPDLAKLTALSLVLNQPETTAETLANIMKSEFSKGKNGEKGPTFGALAGSRTTTAGAEIHKQINEFTTRRRQDKEREKQEARDRETEINDAGIKATDKFIEKGFDHYAPNSRAKLNAFMELQGMGKKARVSYMRTYDGDQANSTQGLNSSDFNNISEQILDDYLTGRTNIREVGEAHNLGALAIGELQRLDNDTKQKVSAYRQEILSSGNTLNRTADAGLLQTLQGKGINKLLKLSDPNISQQEKMQIALGSGTVKVAYSKKIPIIMDLLNIRERFKEAALAEAKLAVSEERSPNTRAIVDKFKIEIDSLVKALEAPPTTKDPEEPKVDKGDGTEEKGIDKKTTVEVINGNPTAIDKFLKTVAEVVSPKKTDDQVLATDKKRMGTGDASEPPKETPVDIVGSSTIATPAIKEQLSERNSDGRIRLEQALKAGESNIVEDGVNILLNNIGDAAQKISETKAWGFFNDVTGSIADAVRSVAPLLPSDAEGSDKLSETPKVFPDSDLMKEAKVKGQELATKEDTTGFKMPDSFEEEAKAREDATVDSLKFTTLGKKVTAQTDKIAAKSDDLARIYNASPTETERATWSANGKKRYIKYREGSTNEIQDKNINTLKDTLDKYKKTFSYDLTRTNPPISFEDFKEYMIMTYGAETNFGDGSVISPTDVVGELQVTRPTLLGDWKRDRNKNKVLVDGKGTWIHGVIGGKGSNKNFGPNMAEKLGFTIKLIKAEPELDRNIAMSDIPKERKRYVLVKDGLAHTVANADDKIRSLLLNRKNKEFSFMAGIAVMINKLQGQR